MRIEASGRSEREPPMLLSVPSAPSSKMGVPPRRRERPALKERKAGVPTSKPRLFRPHRLAARRWKCSSNREVFREC